MHRDFSSPVFSYNLFCLLRKCNATKLNYNQQVNDQSNAYKQDVVKSYFKGYIQFQRSFIMHACMLAVIFRSR